MAAKIPVPKGWRLELIQIFDKLLCKHKGCKDVDIAEINILMSVGSGNRDSIYVFEVLFMKKLCSLKRKILVHGCLIESCLISIFYMFSQLKREPVLQDISIPYKMVMDTLEMGKLWSLKCPVESDCDVFSHFIYAHNKMCSSPSYYPITELTDLFRGIMVGQNFANPSTRNQRVLLDSWNAAYQAYSDFFEICGFTHSQNKIMGEIEIEQPEDTNSSSSTVIIEDVEMNEEKKSD